MTKGILTLLGTIFAVFLSGMNKPSQTFFTKKFLTCAQKRHTLNLYLQCKKIENYFGYAKRLRSHAVPLRHECEMYPTTTPQ